LNEFTRGWLGFGFGFGFGLGCWWFLLLLNRRGGGGLRVARLATPSRTPNDHGK